LGNLGHHSRDESTETTATCPFCVEVQPRGSELRCYNTNPIIDVCYKGTWNMTRATVGDQGCEPSYGTGPCPRTSVQSLNIFVDWEMPKPSITAIAGGRRTWRGDDQIKLAKNRVTSDNDNTSVRRPETIKPQSNNLGEHIPHNNDATRPME
jgi:hypothetical protein